MAKNEKISFYFVLYLAVLLDFLMVVIERDDAEEANKKVLDDLLRDYGKNFFLYVPDTTVVHPNDKPVIRFVPVGLETLSEKEGIHYTLEQITLDDKKQPHTVAGQSPIPVEIDKTKGDGLFRFIPSKGKGDYLYLIWGDAQRLVSMRLPPTFRAEIIKRKHGEYIHTVSDSVIFCVRVAGGDVGRMDRFQGN